MGSTHGDNKNAAGTEMCACELLVGSRGWEHEDWSGRFYPEDLPEDWRLTYYANAFRSVLVPAHQLLHAALEAVSRWTEDVPEGFLFYLEISHELMASVPGARFLPVLDVLGGRVGGTLLQLNEEQGPARERLEAWLAALHGRCPLIASLSGDEAPEDLRQTLAHYRVAAAWRPGVQPWTETRGCMGFLDAPGSDPRGLRAQVEAFIAWAGDCDRALLCFEGTADSCDTMERARVIGELLGA